MKVGDTRLIEWQIAALKRAGVSELVINVAWLADQIVDTLGNGSRYGVDIVYSRECPGELGTGGGIAQALPLLGDDAFMVCNADVWTDFDYTRLSVADKDLAQIVLINNPPHHPNGDFFLDGERVRNRRALTFSGIGVYQPALFHNAGAMPCELAVLLRAAMDENRVSGLLHKGQWFDVGTPERWQQVDKMVKATSA